MNQFQVAVQNEHLESLLSWLEKHKAADVKILDKQKSFCYITWNLQPKLGRHRNLDAEEIIRLLVEENMSVVDIVQQTGMKRSSVYFAIHRYAQENANPFITKACALLKKNKIQRCYLYIPPYDNFIRAIETRENIPAGSVYLGEYGKEREDILHRRYAFHKQKDKQPKHVAARSHQVHLPPHN